MAISRPHPGEANRSLGAPVWPVGDVFPCCSPLRPHGRPFSPRRRPLFRLYDRMLSDGILEPLGASHCATLSDQRFQRTAPPVMPRTGERSSSPPLSTAVVAAADLGTEAVVSTCPGLPI